MSDRSRRARRLAISTGIATGAMLVFAVPAIAGGGGCYGGPTEGSSLTVALAQACPTPTIVHVDPGDTVRFVNKDPLVHNVIGVGFEWGHSDDLFQGDSFSQTFDTPGVYPYACWYHPGMVGAVVVGDAGSTFATNSGTGGTSDAAASSSAVVAEITSDGSGSGAVLGWTLGGALGAVVGIAIGVIVRRRRPAADPGA